MNILIFFSLVLFISFPGLCSAEEAIQQNIENTAIQHAEKGTEEEPVDVQDKNLEQKRDRKDKKNKQEWTTSDYVLVTTAVLVAAGVSAYGVYHFVKWMQKGNVQRVPGAPQPDPALHPHGNPPLPRVPQPEPDANPHADIRAWLEAQRIDNRELDAIANGQRGDNDAVRAILFEFMPGNLGRGEVVNRPPVAFDPAMLTQENVLRIRDIAGRHGDFRHEFDRFLVRNRNDVNAEAVDYVLIRLAGGHH